MPDNFTFPIKTDQVFEGPVNFQILTGPPNIKVGCVALVLHNIPISPVKMPDGSEALVPCVQITARQAMEIGMNMIYIAKLAENYAIEQEKDGR